MSLAKKVQKARATARHLQQTAKLAGELQELETVPCADLENLMYRLAGAKESAQRYIKHHLGVDSGQDAL
jgi:hypothetical protein